MDIMQAVKKIREGQAEVCRRKAWSVGVWAWPDNYSTTGWFCINGRQIREVDLSTADIVGNDWIVT